MILFVRYRNHFPVVQFQNQAHIQNLHGTGQVSKTIWGAARAPNFIFIAAEGGGFAKRGVYGASPPEGDRNPAEGGCFASIYIFIYTLKYL